MQDAENFPSSVTPASANAARFKIDFSGSSGWVYALFFRQRSLLGDKWKEIDRSDSLERVQQIYLKIKDLPQYLA